MDTSDIVIHSVISVTDLDKITEAVVKQMKGLQKNPLTKFVNAQAVHDAIFGAFCEGDLAIFFDKEKDVPVGIVWSQITEPWWTNKKCITEVLVLTLDSSVHGFGRIAVNYLESKAKAVGAAMIETAASMTDEPNALRNLYMKHASFSFSYPAFVKIIETSNVENN